MPRKNASQTILKAAKSCLISGQGRFEMTDIAKEAGVSEGLAYHYFKTKAGLTKAVVADFYRAYHAIINEPLSSEIPWADRERQRLGAVVDFVYDEPFARIVFGLLDGTQEVAEAESTFHAETVDMAVRNIEIGQSQGQIALEVDADIIGAAILGAVRNGLASALRAHPRPSANHLKQQLWRVIAASVGLETSRR